MARAAIFFAMILMAGAALAQERPSASRLDAREQATVLDALRQYASNYVQSLPNYTCTQIIRRVMTPTRSRLTSIGPRPQSDLIEEDLSVVDHREIRKVTKVNGRPAPSSDPEKLQGQFSRGEFGNLLEVLFDPRTKADFRWDRFGTLNGRRMYVFTFRVPQATGYSIEEPNLSIRVPYRGVLYADYETRGVMRVELKCTDIPVSTNYQAVDLTLDYKPTQVANQTFTLPSHYRLYVRTAQGESTNEIDYRAYRRFGSEATITFDEPQ